MKLTIKNLEEIKKYTIEPQYGVEYRVDRIAELPDSYRFYWIRQLLTTDEVVMIQLSRNPVGVGRNYFLNIGDHVKGYIEPETLKNVSAVVDRMTSLFRLL